MNERESGCGSASVVVRGVEKEDGGAEGEGGAAHTDYGASQPAVALQLSLPLICEQDLTREQRAHVRKARKIAVRQTVGKQLVLACLLDVSPTTAAKLLDTSDPKPLSSRHLSKLPSADRAEVERQTLRLACLSSEDLDRAAAALTRKRAA